MERIQKKFGNESRKTPRGIEMHVSDLTGCSLKPYCRMIGLKQVHSKSSIGVMTFGIVAENMIGWTFPNEQLQYQSFIPSVEKDENIFGHIDIYEDNQFPLEVKASRKTVFKASDLPRYWVEQLMCYDERTEMLTKNGFKFFKNITFDDELVTLNPKTEEIEYQKPTKIFKYYYDGKMIQFGGKRHRYDLLVSPEHSLYVKNRNKKFELIKARNLLDKNLTNWSFKKDGKWTGMHPSLFILPTLLIENNTPLQKRPKIIHEVPMKPFLKFLGWYLSEGSIIKNKRGEYIITISQLNDEYKKEIIKCINEMGFYLNISWDRIRIFSRQLYEFVKPFGKYKQKFVPFWVKQLSPELINIFLTALWKGDGSFKNGRMTSYTTTSKQLADDIQELLLKIGLSSCQNYNGKKYVVSANYNHLTPRIITYPIIIDYNGFIYDVTVPNHVLYIRRNGKVCWSGNSYMAMQGANLGWIVMFNVFSTTIMAFQLQMTNDDIIGWLITLADRANRIRKAFKEREPLNLEPMGEEYEYCAYKKECPRRLVCRDKYKEFQRKKKEAKKVKKHK